MKRIINLIPCVFVLLAGCATISGQISMENFDKISRAYENALLRSQFITACQFLDPATVKEEIDFNKYENIKVVDYAAGDFVLSEDKVEIRQDVEIQYYLRDLFVLNSIQDKQIWKYYKEDKIWLLQTGLPTFND